MSIATAEVESKHIPKTRIVKVGYYPHKIKSRDELCSIKQVEAVIQRDTHDVGEDNKKNPEMVRFKTKLARRTEVNQLIVATKGREGSFSKIASDRLQRTYIGREKTDFEPTCLQKEDAL